VFDAIRASFSIPGIFSLAKHQGKYLVDGGLVNPVPVSTVRNMGAEFIIVVHFMPAIDTTN
jgi:NTE family protein